MTDFLKGAYAGATAQMVAALYEEFRADTIDRAQQLDAELAVGQSLEPFGRFAFETKGQAHNFNFALLEVACQRMENYLQSVTALDERSAGDIGKFLNTVIDILEGRIADDRDPGQLSRALPARRSAFDVEDIEIRDIEVMLVMLQDAQARFVEREVRACGYRATIIPSTTEALAQAIHTKPDFVIVSAMMPGLSGIDFAIGIAAMPETRNTPVALITSLPPSDDKLKLLPPFMPIIRKSDSFGDDLAEALNSHFLL